MSGLTRERIEELTEKAKADLHSPWTVKVKPAELLALLDAALAWRRLEEWLNEDIDRNAQIGACGVGVFVPDSEFAAGQCDVTPPGDLLSAVTAALDQAEGAGR